MAQRSYRGCSLLLGFLFLLARGRDGRGGVARRFLLNYFLDDLLLGRVALGFRFGLLGDGGFYLGGGGGLRLDADLGEGDGGGGGGGGGGQLARDDGGGERGRVLELAVGRGQHVGGGRRQLQPAPLRYTTKHTRHYTLSSYVRR